MRIKLAENSKRALALLGIALLLGGTYAWTPADRRSWTGRGSQR